MKIQRSALTLALLSVLAISQAEARDHGGEGGFRHGHGHGGHHGQLEKGSFVEDGTRTYSDGRVFKRHTEQTVDGNRLARRTTLTNPEGRTATREVKSEFDPQSKQWSQKVTGKDFDGKSYAREASGQRTENGFEHQSRFTGPDGKTGAREVVGTVDKDKGTLTRKITVTRPDGTKETKTVVNDREAKKR